MIYLIINWVLSTLTLLLISTIVPGFRVLDFGSAMIAAGSVGLISALLGLVLKYVGGPVSFTISAVFLFVVDAFLFRLSALLVPGFAMLGFTPAIAGAVALLALNLVLLRVAPLREEAFDSKSLLSS